MLRNNNITEIPHFVRNDNSIASSLPHAPHENPVIPNETQWNEESKKWENTILRNISKVRFYFICVHHNFLRYLRSI